MREKEHRLGDVTNLALGEQRLVVRDQRDDVSPGDVAVIDDREPGGMEVEAHAADSAPRNGRANGARMEHSGEHEVIDVPRSPVHLLRGILARHVGTDGGHRGRMQALYVGGKFQESGVRSQGSGMEKRGSFAAALPLIPDS